jgi:MFS family permease
MGFLKLLRTHPRTLGFGLLNSFFSGLGQTHFISIFSPLLMTRFALSNTQYGSLYSLVTLGSGLIIPFLGPLIDKKDVRHFGAFIGIGLILSQFFLIHASHILVLAFCLFGLRLFGQGLCSTLSSIVIARYFTQDRGKALSVCFLGFPLYEGLITPLFVFLLATMSFLNIGYILIASIAFIYIPLILWLTKSLPSFNKPVENIEKISLNSDIPETLHWERKQVFRERKIYLLLPQTLMPPFALTGLLFHQAAIGNFKGWNLSIMASGLIFFALGRSFTTFTAGPLVDKYKARTLFPFYQCPLILGFMTLALGTASWTPALSFALFGLAVGSGGPIKAAIWAELYGTRHLGAIKSALATIMVLSTAASPALFGWLLDTLKEAHSLLYFLTGISFLAAVLSYFALKETSDSSLVS